MADKPKDRDEAKRPEAPGGDPDAAKRKDAPRAKDDQGGYLPDDSFLLDMGEAAPRVRAGGNEDANEEWLLVDDDLVSASSDGDMAPKSLKSAKSAGDDARREAEAVRLVNDMKDAGSDFGTVPNVTAGASEPPPDVAARIAEVESQAVAPMDAPSASEPAPTFDESALNAPPVEVPAEAPAPAEDAEPAKAEKKKAKGPKSTRRPLAFAAGLLFTAALGAGGWYAWQKYGPFPAISKLLGTEVASQPDPTPAPSAGPTTAKPAPKPAKPAPTATKPPDATGTKPTATATNPPDTAQKVDPAGSIPVIQANPTAPSATPVGDPNVQPAVPSKDPVAKSPSKPATSGPVIIDPRQPIRPAKVMPGDLTAKSAVPAKKTDTIIELKNGYTMRGRLKRVKDEQITLGVPNGEFTFPLADVKVLDSSAPDYLAPADMPPISVVLKGGQRLRGKKLKEDADHVVIVVDQGQIVVARNDIREVSPAGRIHY